MFFYKKKDTKKKTVQLDENNPKTYVGAYITNHTVKKHCRYSDDVGLR